MDKAHVDQYKGLNKWKDVGGFHIGDRVKLNAQLSCWHGKTGTVETFREWGMRICVKLDEPLTCGDMWTWFDPSELEKV